MGSLMGRGGGTGTLAVLLLCGAWGQVTAGSTAPAVATPREPAPTPAAVADTIDAAHRDYIPPGPLARRLRVGERCEFSIQYGPIKAGTAVLSVEGVEQIEGRECYQLLSVARSNGFFSAFYKVKDRIESFVDVDDHLTRRSSKHLEEGDYRQHDVIDWHQDSGIVEYDDGDRITIPPGTLDILGAFYYVRMLDLQVGDRIPLMTHDNRKTYPLWVSVLGTETIDTPVGRFDCLVVEPKLETHGLFRRTGSLQVWLTRDEALPVMMRSSVKVGAISAILTGMDRGETATPRAARATAR